MASVDAAVHVGQGASDQPAVPDTELAVKRLQVRDKNDFQGHLFYYGHHIFARSDTWTLEFSARPLNFQPSTAARGAAPRAGLLIYRSAGFRKKSKVVADHFGRSADHF